MPPITEQISIDPLWTVKMQQLLCVIENPEADQEIVFEAKKVLLNLATYVDLMNSMQEGIYEQTLSFERLNLTIH
tara:strand:+ start:2224 stop:2448 length:225 start_codon:yes stop_codon:yes gene_type:complete